MGKYFQKSSIWFLLVATFCAIRAPSTFTVVLAYIQVLFRLFQVIALMLKKRMLAKVAYAFCSIVIVLMFFGAMVDQTHIVSFY